MLLDTYYMQDLGMIRKLTYTSQTIDFIKSIKEIKKEALFTIINKVLDV